MSVPDYFDSTVPAGGDRPGADQRAGQPPAWFGLPIPLVLGVAVGLVGFVITVDTLATTARNGVVTQCTHTDFSAWLWAAATAVVGAVGFVQALRRPGDWAAPRVLVWVMAAATALMAVLHLMRALGVIGDPCPGLLGTRP